MGHWPPMHANIFSLYSQVIEERNQWICNIFWNVIDFPKNTKISALNNIDVEFKNYRTTK